MLGGLNILITGIIMASGYSKRMGRDKLLMDINGKKMVENIVKSALSSKLDEVILVYRNEEVKNAVEKYGIKSIYNKKAYIGQSQSIIVGVKNAKHSNYMFLAADQPYVTSCHIDNMIRRFKEKKDKIIVSYTDTITVPIIFPNRFKKHLLDLNGDIGGRDIIKKNIEFTDFVQLENYKLLMDIDTIKEYNEISKIGDKN